MWHIRKAQRMQCTPENTEVADKSPGSVLHMAKRVYNAMEKNHFTKQCPSKLKPKSVHLVKGTNLSETFFVGMVSCVDTQEMMEDSEEHDGHSRSGQTWLVSLQINGTIVALRIDAGAQANLISIPEVIAIKEKPKIIKKRVSLKDYNEKDIENKG